MTVPLPTKPLVKPWYRLARSDGRLAVEYGQHVVSLEGRAVERLLPALLPLLDGTRTLDDVVAHLGEPIAPAVENALQLLAEHGLVTEGPPLDDVPQPFAATAAAAAAHWGAPPAEPHDALAAAHAAVVGSGAIAAEVARLLNGSGVGRVTRGDWSQPQVDASLVVVAPSADEIARVPQWNRVALERRTPWLQVLPYDGRLAAVGPLYLPPDTCCYECYRIRRASNSGYADEFRRLDAVPIAAPQPPALTAVVAGTAASIAGRHLAVSDPFATGVFFAVEHGEHLSITKHHVYRVPRCPACSATASTSAPIPWGDV